MEQWPRFFELFTLCCGFKVLSSAKIGICYCDFGVIFVPRYIIWTRYIYHLQSTPVATYKLLWVNSFSVMSGFKISYFAINDKPLYSLNRSLKIGTKMMTHKSHDELNCSPIALYHKNYQATLIRLNIHLVTQTLTVLQPNQSGCSRLVGAYGVFYCSLYRSLRFTLFGTRWYHSNEQEAIG